MEDEKLKTEEEETTEVSEFDGLPKKYISSRFSIMTPEQRKEAGRKGGTKTAQIMKERKAFRETLLILLGMPMKKGKVAHVEDIKAFADLKGKNVDMQTAGLIAQVQKFAKGDKDAAIYIRDTIGERPLNVPLEDDNAAEQIANASEIVFQVRRAPVSEEGAEDERSTDDSTTDDNRV